MVKMGAHEKESDLAVWTMELFFFFKIYCKQQQQQQKQKQTITSMHSDLNNGLLFTTGPVISD